MLHLLGFFKKQEVRRKLAFLQDDGVLQLLTQTASGA
jgi:hypothetical protein